MTFEFKMTYPDDKILRYNNCDYFKDLDNYSLFQITIDDRMIYEYS